MKYVHLNMRPALRDRLKIIASKEHVFMVDQVERWIVDYEQKEKQNMKKNEEQNVMGCSSCLIK